MVALWLPLLFKGEGRRVPTLIQTGFAARLSSSKLSPLQRGKKTFNKRWLVPSAGSPARAASSVPELPFCISLPLRAFSFCFLLSPLPLLNRLSPTSPLSLLLPQHISPFSAIPAGTQHTEQEEVLLEVDRESAPLQLAAWALLKAGCLQLSQVWTPYGHTSTRGHNSSIQARSLSPPELCACVAGEGNSNAQAQTLSALQPRGLWRAFCSIPPSPINSLHKLKFWTSSALCFTTLCCSGSTKGRRSHTAWEMTFSPLLCTFPTPVYHRSQTKVSLSVSLKIIVKKE